MKMKILSLVAGLAAVLAASQANAQALLTGYYTTYAIVTASNGAGCSLGVGGLVSSGIHWPGFNRPGFAVASLSQAAPQGVAVFNGFPNTPPNPAALAAGWAGNATYTGFFNGVVGQGPAATGFNIAAVAVVNGVAQGTFTFNVPALPCNQTLQGTLIYSGK